MPKKTSDPSPATSLWRHRDFVLLWSGGAVSDLGSAVSTLVLPLIAVQLHATTFQVALLGVMGRLPFLVLSLPAGVLVDRMDRRSLMLWCDAGRMLAIGSIPLVSLLGGKVSMWQLALAALAVGSLRVVFDVADQSYLPVLLPRENLVDANGKLRSTQMFADSVGPSLGAGLTALLGAAARAITADSLSYAVSVGSLLLIRNREPKGATGASAPRVGFRAAMSEGLRFVLGDAILRRIAVSTATANLGICLVTAIEVVFLVRVVHSSPTQIGLVLGLGTIGGVGGSLVARRLTDLVGTARIMWMALVVPAPLVFLMPLAQSGWEVLTYAAG